MQSLQSNDITPPIMRSKYWYITFSIVYSLALIRGLRNFYPIDVIPYSNTVIDKFVALILLLTLPTSIIPLRNFTSAISLYRSGGDTNGVHIEIFYSIWMQIFVYVVVYTIPYIRYFFLILELFNLLTIIIVFKYRSRINISLGGGLLMIFMASRLFYQGFGTYRLI